MTENFNPNEWITTKEAAELTRYHPTHIRWLIREDRIEGRKLGRDWLIDRESLEEYARNMKSLGPAKHDPWRTGARQKDGQAGE
jgi:excisionase family DNA binding protein